MKKDYASCSTSELVRISLRRGFCHVADKGKNALVRMLHAYDRRRAELLGLSGAQLQTLALAHQIPVRRGRRSAEKRLRALMKVWARSQSDPDGAPSMAPAVVPRPRTELDQPAFEQRLAECSRPMATTVEPSRGGESKAAVDELSDRQLAAMAELYLDATAIQRDQLRGLFDDRDTWPLVLYIRQVGRHIRSRDDVHWLRRGLAVAAMENARSDYRDLIVSLVLLRFAAEQAGMFTQGYFDEAIGFSTPKMHPLLTNARDHSRQSIQATVAAFRSPQFPGRR